MKDSVDVVAWNPHVGNSEARVLDTLTAELTPRRPDIIALNEVRRHREALARWGLRNGYDVLQEMPLRDDPTKPKPEHGSSALLITEERPDLSPGRERVSVGRIPWKVFSHDRMHAPRRSLRRGFRTAGGRWKVSVDHFPTLGFEGGNRLAFAESVARLAAFLLVKIPGTVAFGVGDHNERAPRLRRWARTVAARVVGHSVDSLIITGGRAEADVKGKHGSDHHLVRYTVTRGRR